MIELLNLTKRYGQMLAVDTLNLTITPGEVFGFLGPNGAGKTTTILMMMGLLQPTSGSVRLAGYDLAREGLAAKQLCGFVPDRPHVYEKLTGAEFLDFVAGLYHVEASQVGGRRDDLLEMFDLTQWATELVEGYSHGMKQRTVLAAALLHDPQVLVVDEPMIGLDPRSVRTVKELFRRLADQGRTVFMSTHTLEVAEAIADRMAIINHGRIISCGTLAELRAKAAAEQRLEDIFLDLTEPDAGRAPAEGRRSP